MKSVTSPAVGMFTCRHVACWLEMDISKYIYSACYDDVYLEVGMVNMLKFSSPWLNERDVALWEIRVH